MKKSLRPLLIVALLAIALLAGVIWGWEMSFAAVIVLGGALGVALGVSSGNKKAREVDEYREQWLSKKPHSKGEKDTDSGDGKPGPS